MLSDEQKKGIIDNRILRLEMELFNFNMDKKLINPNDAAALTTLNNNIATWEAALKILQDMTV